MKQRGYNSAYPEEIETWSWGEKIPEWLSDRCKINRVNEDGSLVMDVIETTSGGYEIKNSAGDEILIIVKHKSYLVCFGGGRLFQLTPRQVELLYE